ncbi:hypothetical protein GGI21_004017, partial [Coemansia aciculifera]
MESTRRQDKKGDSALSLPHDAPDTSESEQDDGELFFEASEESATQPPAPAPSSFSMPLASPIAGVDDSLQAGVDLAMRAVWLFLDSDFEQIKELLHKKRHALLYASEGYAAIQYLRAMMTFTKEAMGSAQEAAESTIHLSAYYRKPRGVGALLSGPPSRSSSPQVAAMENGSSAGNQPKPPKQTRQSSFPFRSGAEKSTGGGGSSSWLDSPRLTLRGKKGKRLAESAASTPGSVASMDSIASAESEFELPDDASYASDGVVAAEALEDDEPKLDRPPHRSWTSGLTGVADSLLGMVRAGSQAVGISKPDWHVLRTMTPTQRHAELVHAEAYLMRAVLNVASGDGVMAVLKEGWHVRSAYATYRGCYAYIQDIYAEGGTVDDHFVSGTYLGMGIFNLVLSMLPAKLLRFVELVGFKADRRLGLELLALAAGWRSDPAISPLMDPPAASISNNADIHPCGMGLRSEFCSIVLQGYHVFLCSDLFLGYPNLPLVDAVLRRAAERHPRGLIFMYFDGRLLMSRTRLDDAIARLSQLVRQGKGAVKDMNLGQDARIEKTPDDNVAESLLIKELGALRLDSSTAAAAASTPDDETPQPNAGVATGSTSMSSSASEWRQLQYLGFWERSLCLMALGRWMEAAEGFNTLRKENNWNKAVYTYALAACIWEHSLTLTKEANRENSDDEGE